VPGLMNKLAKLSADERRRLIGDLLGTVFGGLDARLGFAGIMRSMTPEVPDDPEAEQVEAWLELAELSQDPDFRASLRRMAEHMRPTALRAMPRACAGTRSPLSGTRSGRPWSPVSARPRLRPIRSSRRSRLITRMSWVVPTTPTFCAGC
jgi:hypothetical protein